MDLFQRVEERPEADAGLRSLGGGEVAQVDPVSRVGLSGRLGETRRHASVDRVSRHVREIDPGVPSLGMSLPDLGAVVRAEPGVGVGGLLRTPPGEKTRQRSEERALRPAVDPQPVPIVPDQRPRAVGRFQTLWPLFGVGDDREVAVRRVQGTLHEERGGLGDPRLLHQTQQNASRRPSRLASSTVNAWAPRSLRGTLGVLGSKARGKSR